MILSSRESVVGAARGKALGLALLLALGGSAVPLGAQARANGGHSEGSASEASHGRSAGGDRGSWNSGGGSSGGSSGGGTAVSSGSGSGSSGNDGSSVQPRSGGSSGGDRGRWNDRNRGGDRGHRGGRGHYGYGYGYRSPYYNPWWGWWGWGWGWGEPYGGGYGGYGRGYGDGDEQGALDLDIWPGDTQVWLDGQHIGTVDDFDGFPTYLWLEKGTYDLVFYRDGYQTLARQYSIYPGLTIDVGDRLSPGESIRPEDLPTKTHERRDARIDEERVRSERIDTDRERYRDGREAGEPSRLILSIEPGDASVYLDGKFIGTADEISRLHRGLMVEAGQHRISVVRPGRRGAEQTITVGPGDEEEVEIQLEKSDE